MVSTTTQHGPTPVVGLVASTGFTITDPGISSKLLSFEDIPNTLTNPNERGGVISNSMGPYRGLSFHGEPDVFARCAGCDLFRLDHYLLHKLYITCRLPGRIRDAPPLCI